MNYRWFKIEELGVHPEAPKEDELVWGWFGEGGLPREIHDMALPLRSCSAAQNGPWYLEEYERGFDLKEGDMVCRVLRPEAPTTEKNT